MNLLTNIYSRLEKRYSPRLVADCLTRMHMIDHGNYCENPFLQQDRDVLRDGITEDAVQCTKKINRYENVTAHDQHVTFSLADTIRFTTPQEIFRFLAEHTCHANASGDFRVDVPYYARICSGLDYFLYHGDGNCLLLSFLFQSLVHAHEVGDVSLWYHQYRKGEYCHVFCTMDEGLAEMVYDLDQKVLFPMAESATAEPRNFLCQLIAIVGNELFEELCQKGESWLFNTMIKKVLERYCNGNQTHYHYRADGTYSALAEYYQAMFTQRAYSRVSMDSDDYSWKKEFRDAAVSYVGPHKTYMMGRLLQPSSIALPPHSEMTIGLHDDTPEEIVDLCLILWGRVPCCITMPMAKNVDHDVQFMTIPWLIECKEDIGSVVIDAQTYAFRRSRKGTYCIGMGDMERVSERIRAGKKTLTISASQACVLQLYFPFNPSVLNSDDITITYDPHAVVCSGDRSVV